MKKKLLSVILGMTLTGGLAFADDDSQAQGQQAVSQSGTITQLDATESTPQDDIIDEPIDAVAIQEVNDAVAATPTPVKASKFQTAEQMLVAQMQAYRDEHLSNIDDMNIFEGTANASATVDDPAFSRAVQIAYERAFINTQSEFVTFKFIDTTQKQILTNYADNSSNANQLDNQNPNSNTISSIWAKIKALTGAKLDRKLKENGIDPSTLSKDPEQAKILALQEYTKTVLTKSFGDLTGLMPVKTFVVTDEKGNVAVGVTAIYSNKIRGYIESIRSGYQPTIKGEGGRAISDFLNIPAEDLINTFGVSVVFDQNNLPVILSYGQASLLGKEVKGISRSQNAIGSATQTARGNIALFLAGQMSVEEQQTQGDRAADMLVKNLTTGQVSGKTDNVITDILSQNYQTSANIHLSGVKRVKTWQYESDNGQQTYGVVLAYSAAQQQVAQDMVNYKPNPKPTRPDQDSNKHDPSVKSSVNNPYLNQF